MLAETAHLLRRHGCDTDPLLALVKRGVLNIAFSIETELGPLRRLLRRYRDQPISLADACLVHLAALHDKPRRLDAGFRFPRLSPSRAAGDSDTYAGRIQ